VTTLFNTIFYNGDGSTVYFATESGTEPAGGPEVVFKDDVMQLDYAIYPQIGDYTIVINPDGEPPGRYVQFIYPPETGFKNIKICAPTLESKITSSISHTAGTIVQDGGFSVTIQGGYAWQPAPNGLQYNNTSLAYFLLENSGTRN
jgi:hypothetical protein